MAKEQAFEVVATNRKAGRDYELLDRYEAGVALTGTEIKSVRQHKVTLNDSFARLHAGEGWLYNCHISPYEAGNRFNVEPTRTRKVLLHRREIERLIGLTSRKGMLLIPTRMYLKHGLAKVEIALAKSKRQYEKRDTIRQRDTQRELDRARRTTQHARRKQGGD